MKECGKREPTTSKEDTVTWCVPLRDKVSIPGFGEGLGEQCLAALQTKVLGIGTGEGSRGEGEGGRGGGRHVWEGRRGSYIVGGEKAGRESTLNSLKQ